MVKYHYRPGLTSPGLDLVFHALADPTRRRILDRLAGAERTVVDISRPFRLSLPAVSKHLKILETADLIHRRIQGRQHYCRVNPTALRNIHNWLAFYQRSWTDHPEHITF